MDKSNFLELKLPSRNNTTDIADINVISENFEVIDEAFKNIIDDVLPEYQTKENMRSVISDAVVSDKYYPSLNAVRNYITPRDEKIKQHEKRITNIEKRFANEPFEIDDEWGMTKVVPDGVMPYASVNKVGGMSYKSRNLLNITATTQTVNGVTFTVNADKSITVNGTATNNIFLILVKNLSLIGGKTYYLSGMKSGYANIGLQITNATETESLALDAGSGRAYTPVANENVYIRFMVATGNSFNNITIYPQLEEGTEATTYEPYYSGIRNTEVSEVKSVGKNLLNVPQTTTLNYNYLLKQFPIHLKANITYTFSILSNVSCQSQLDGFTENGRIIFTKLINLTHTGLVKYTFTPAGDISYLSLYVNGANVTLTNPQIEIGTTATEYTPYKETFILIPEQIKSLNGYGLGINKDIYNYIDFERGVYVQNCAEVDLGSLTWNKETLPTGSYRFVSGRSGIAPSPNAVTKANILCSAFEVISNANSYNGYYGIAITHNSSDICVSGAEYNAMTTEQFKSAMSGVYLIYELKTPIETDISDYIQDNFIEVQSGGILTAVNEYNYDTQFEVEYMMGG